MGVLPSDYFALPEQSIRGPILDVLTLHLSPVDDAPPTGGTGLAVAAIPPRARVVSRKEEVVYSRKTDRLIVRHRSGDVVAVIEIVSPGNKGSKSELRAFVEKMSTFIQKRVHAMAIDLFPPTKRDPFGIHKAIWDEFLEEDFVVPPDKPLVVAAYEAGAPDVAYVESVGVGDALPDAPLFLKRELYVPTPLESTYQTAWDVFPRALKPLLDESPPRNGGGTSPGRD